MTDDNLADDEFVEQVDDPKDSRFYEERHEQLDQLPEHERKSGTPSPMTRHDREVAG